MEEQGDGFEGQGLIGLGEEEELLPKGLLLEPRFGRCCSREESNWYHPLIERTS